MRLDVYSMYGHTGASTRVRILDWLKHTGVTAEIHEYRGQATNSASDLVRDPASTMRAELALRRRRLGADVVFMSRGATPFGAGRTEQQILQKARHSVFDFDDAVMLADARPIHNLIAQPTRKFERLVRSADVVIAGNEWLAEQASPFGDQVTVIPSCVEPDDYTQKTHYHIGETPRLIWLGSGATERHLTSILPALTQVHEITGARVTVISTSKKSILDRAPFVDRIAWSEGAHHLLGEADVALAPLVPGTWELGKCAYKALQYGASAIPMVSSPIGANAAVAKAFGAPSATGMSDWADAIVDLLRARDEERRELGLRARAQVYNNYSFAAWKETWQRLVFES